MFDTVAWTLSGVRHVLGLRKNWISLGALNCCRCFVRVGLKVVEGNKVVIRSQKVESTCKMVRSMINVELVDSGLSASVTGGSWIYAGSQRYRL